MRPSASEPELELPMAPPLFVSDPYSESYALPDWLRPSCGGKECWESREGELFGSGLPSVLFTYVRNKDLLLSWLPVVSPVGRPTAGYRAPTAPPASS